MKSTIITLCLLFMCYPICSQTIENIDDLKLYDLKFDSLNIDECGDVRKLSSVSVLTIAFVKEIVKPNEIIVEEFILSLSNDEKREKIFKRVILAGINITHLPVNQVKILKKTMTKILLDQEVQVLANATHNISSDTLYAEVLFKGKNINYSLIRNGFAIFSENKPYELNWWDRCQYKKAEKIAKEKKIGFWAN